MLKWSILAFGLGYMTASTRLVNYLLQEKTVLYILSSLCICFLLIYFPLDFIAQHESTQNPMTNLRTSAREHLQRRGSF
ncbi:uncharacterized protein B0P05DRAFT_549209 [Gilbertella persicaria]|uniref:uncharacterized protein n=1 Tax=Gilbertella persicaria TaxID=101096 RepID=UPI00221F4080|nr:uncharacterized protein B0P05DRAFT_549209 [Gilbertella persicaria]KAI8072182.1 hypothetical protein B0P05DRAFT_549209 [Gilbertella persicaria]